jgi:hypothetical protein
MTLIARFHSLIGGLLRRKSMESSMADEMSFHIAAYTSDLIRSGVPSAEAARRARVELAESRFTRRVAGKRVAFDCWTTCGPIYASPAGRSRKVHRFPLPQF